LWDLVLGGAATAPAPTASPATAEASPSTPVDDDERFIVGLVLTYYRRHPQRARTRLLDLLGEVLTPEPAPAPRSAAKPAASGAQAELDAWRKLQAGVALILARCRQRMARTLQVRDRG
jgi:hypothetical protein